MPYQTTTKTSYGTKAGRAFKNTFTGILLIIVGTIAIFWNENRAVKTYKAINNSEKNCVEMPDISKVNPEFNGKIVHCSGTALTDDILTDAIFGVSINGFHLEREVSYFQNVEKEHREEKEKIGGSTETITTYTYESKWVSSPVASAEFKDPAYKNSNFVNVNVEAKEWEAENVSFGAFKLPEFIISQIDSPQDAVINMTDTLVGEWNRKIRQTIGNNEPAVQNDTSGRLGQFSTINYVHIQGNSVYFGKNPDFPSIGDVKVNLTYTPNNQLISIIAKVNNNTFEHYIAKNKRSFAAVQMGDVSAEAMFESARQENKIMTWMIRVILILLIIAGFKAATGLLPALLKVLPFLGKGVENILGFVSAIIGVIWSFIWIGIAWIAVRPVISITLLAAIIVLVVFLRKRSKKKQQLQPDDN